VDLVDLVVSGFLAISWGFWGFGGFWVPGHFSGFLATFPGSWPDPGFLGGVARSGHFRLGGVPVQDFLAPQGPDSRIPPGSTDPGVRGSGGPGGARSGRKGTDPVGMASVVSGRPWSDSGSNPKLK